MRSHRSIMQKIGEAVATSATVLAYCRTHFGRGLDVHVGAYPDGVPGDKDSPFLWILAAKDENEAVKVDETFTVRLIVGGCVKGPDGESVINNVIAERKEDANGITVNGGNLIVEDLRDIILGIVRNAKAGAIVAKIRRDENDISHFPLEWANVYVDYFEPESLT